ncbi:putative glycoside hydrolase [Salicibibacter cibi]|uniref:Putative glycoside hydrolase n=1 Tax=Salicibibacter cibi TaxID=2743001 RepID=A0A7T6ZCX4_9BACI|nr:putative glycoside hydrolase [Salicibibacter cibi]QQK80711.1 putative glycoside hydrolase [Salicibibacter cibi]
MSKKITVALLAGAVAFGSYHDPASAEEDGEEQENGEEEGGEEEEEALFELNDDDLLALPRLIPDRFTYDSGVEIEYPEDGVKGVFSTAHSMGGDNADDLVNLVNDTTLNSIVVDVKDDHGFITYETDSDDERIQANTNEIIDDMEGMMDTYEENDIYPIARIVVFKDTELAEEEPELSFLDNGDVWSNNSGESFVNPFSEEVWEYNIEVAKEAAEAGFKEIQFDYIRFPEGFENRDDDLEYTEGNYAESGEDNVQNRVDAVTDFVEYAREELRPYGVKVSGDIFGYAATVDETPGIGQNFTEIAENVDIMSSMIYPSHWTPHFGIDQPDLEPYDIVDEYAQLENELMDDMEDPPISRPWLQDFTASYLSDGDWMEYGADEVEAQIQALYDNDIYEFLLWDAANDYSEGADYELDAEQDIVEEDSD